MYNPQLDTFIHVADAGSLNKAAEAGKSLYSDAKYLIQYSKDSIARAKNTMPVDENMTRIGTSPMTPEH